MQLSCRWGYKGGATVPRQSFSNTIIYFIHPFLIIKIQSFSRLKNTCLFWPRVHHRETALKLNQEKTLSTFAFTQVSLLSAEPPTAAPSTLSFSKWMPLIRFHLSFSLNWSKHTHYPVRYVHQTVFIKSFAFFCLLSGRSCACKSPLWTLRSRHQTSSVFALCSWH